MTIKQYIVINLVTFPKTGDKEMIVPVTHANWLGVKFGKISKRFSTDNKRSIIVLSGILI
jgi:hypothetical protein